MISEGIDHDLFYPNSWGFLYHINIFAQSGLHNLDGAVEAFVVVISVLAIKISDVCLLTPRGRRSLFWFVYEVTAINFGYSFDAEFLKPLVLIDLFVVNMRM